MGTWEPEPKGERVGEGGVSVVIDPGTGRPDGGQRAAGAAVYVQGDSVAGWVWFVVRDPRGGDDDSESRAVAGFVPTQEGTRSLADAMLDSVESIAERWDDPHERKARWQQLADAVMTAWAQARRTLAARQLSPRLRR